MTNKIPLIISLAATFGFSEILGNPSKPKVSKGKTSHDLDRIHKANEKRLRKAKKREALR